MSGVLEEVEPYPRCPICGSLMQPLTPIANPNYTGKEILWWCINNTCNYNELRSLG